MSAERLWTFAGDHMRITTDDAGTATIEYGERSLTGRVCGSCTLCCKLVPVAEINKAAGTRCKHSKHGHGCVIYTDRPYSCRSWSCMWVASPETAGMPRPDRAHYVIDMTADHVIAQPEDGSAPSRMNVIQVWCDPAHRDAYKAPELRAYMELMATKYGAATIVRWNSNDAVVVFPPSLTGRGWEEKGGSVKARNAFEQQILDMAARDAR